MLKNYFKIAWRNLKKNKVTSIVNITGLSIGMSAAVLILLWVQNEYSYDSNHPNGDRIYRVTFQNAEKTYKWDGSPLPLGEAIRQKIPEVANVAKFSFATWDNPTLSINNELYREKIAVFIDSNWFKLFHYDFVEGNATAFNRIPHSIILTQSLTRKYFGKKPAVGHIIGLDSANYYVQAVVKDNPSNSSFQFPLFLPLEAHLSHPENRKRESSWDNFSWQTYVQLNPSVTPQKVAAKIADLFKGNKKDGNYVISLTALKDIHFETGIDNPKLPHGNKKVIVIFAILGSLLLFIACINYVNLTTAEASLRTKEISIKKIVGANRRMLFGEFIMESCLTSLLALILTLVIIQICIPVFNSFTEMNFVFSLSSLQIWALIGGTLVITALLTGIYPAALLSSFKPLNILRGFNLLKVKNTTFRKTLVVSQFVIAISLMVSTIVIFKQLQFIQTQNEGYNRSQIFSVVIPPSWSDKHKNINVNQFKNAFKEELKNTTNIENAAFTSESIIDIKISMAGIVQWEGKKDGFDPMVSFIATDDDFRRVYPLEMKEGRWFQPNTRKDKHNYILNETATNEFNLHKPYIGQRFVFGGDTGQVIGIVKDFHYRSFHEKIGSMILFNNASMLNNLSIKTAPGKAAQAIKATERTWKKFFPDQPFEYNFLDESFNQLYRADIKTSILIEVFTIIAIILSCLGLFGLAAFAAEQRTKEIGIRKVLGADIRNIMALLSRDFVKLVAIALLIASPIAAWAMNKWLQDFPYRIDIRWWMFFMAGVIALLIALITISFHSIKAAIANPVKSLRTE
jgi:putative ABC transport system permease protein